MTRLTELAVRNKSVALLFATALFVGGLVSWGQLRQELLPDIELPIVTVIAALPGAGAEQVAGQVTDPIESAIRNVPRLEAMQSTSANSVSLVIAQFEFGTDIKQTRSTIESAVRGATLPEAVDPQVSALDFNDQPIIIASIGPGPSSDPAEAARIAQEELLPLVRGLDGVSAAELTGGATTSVLITLRPAAMAQAGTTLQQVSGVLQANALTLPAGTLTDGTTKLPVSATNSFTSLDELKSLVVAVAPSTTEGGQPAVTTLGQIATVDLDEINASGYARRNSLPALTLTISKASGANTVNVSDAFHAAVADVMARHPGAIAVDTVSDVAEFVKESRDGLVREGLLGAIFAVLTIFVFLLNVRSTLVAAMSIPLSILTALAVMSANGMTINVITLGGLAVAVGRVVDDAIVVLENIYRHRARGDEIGKAVVSGTREVATAITSSTLTTVAVFLPLGFVGGIVSQFFLPFALAVTFALLASLGVALTIVPVLAYFFVRAVPIKVDATGELPETVWQRLYTPILRLALRSRITRWATLGIALALFVGSLALIPLLPTSFLDTGSEAILEVTVSPPQGASAEAVLERTQQVEAVLLADQPAVELVQTSIPGDDSTGAQTLQAAFQGRSGNSARMTVRLVPGSDLDAKTRQYLRELGPLEQDGFDIAVGEQQSFGGGGGLQVIVSGDVPRDIRNANDAIVAVLRSVPDVVNLESDLTSGAQVVQIDVDPNRALMVGMTTAQVAGSVRDALVGQTLGTVSLDGGDRLDLVIKIDSSALASVDALRAMPVGTVASAPLGSIADVDQVQAQGSVSHVDGTLAATISGDIVGDDQGAVTRKAQELIDALRASGAIADGVTIRLAGVAEAQAEAFGSLFLSMGVAILLVYVVMVVVFGSLVDPFIILFSLPLATIGAFPMLLLTGRSIGLSALIGFLMLIGIVITNAIVLIDLVEQLRHRGLSTYDALIQGGRTRVRPILMTAVATIMALLPVTLGFAEGSIIAGDLGTVVIGGLFSSTALTLVIVPVVYSLVDDAKQWASRRFGGATAAEPAEPEPAPSA
jgi:HAE1 family hydrophobic/amphiphilic exporter-1